MMVLAKIGKSSLSTIALLIVVTLLSGCATSTSNNRALGVPLTPWLLPPHGVVMVEGQNITGMLEVDSNTSIAYTYSYQPMESGPLTLGMLEATFDLVSVPAVDDDLLYLVVLDQARSAVFGQVLFEFRRGANLTGLRRQIDIQAYTAFSFNIMRITDSS